MTAAVYQLTLTPKVCGFNAQMYQGMHSFGPGLPPFGHKHIVSDVLGRRSAILTCGGERFCDRELLDRGENREVKNTHTPPPVMHLEALCVPHRSRGGVSRAEDGGGAGGQRRGRLALPLLLQELLHGGQSATRLLLRC